MFGQSISITSFLFAAAGLRLKLHSSSESHSTITSLLVRDAPATASAARDAALFAFVIAASATSNSLLHDLRRAAACDVF